MATTRRDYYEVLGVERTAGEADIKKAFRGLARSLHPDVSDEPDAEERVREGVEGYEGLSKPGGGGSGRWSRPPGSGRNGSRGSSTTATVTPASAAAASRRRA